MSNIIKSIVFLVYLETEQKALGDLKGRFLQILSVTPFSLTDQILQTEQVDIAADKCVYMSILTLLKLYKRNKSYKTL